MNGGQLRPNWGPNELNRRGTTAMERADIGSRDTVLEARGLVDGCPEESIDRTQRIEDA